jgi:CopG family transcriptional regulator, nickel-responsive regulator
MVKQKGYRNRLLAIGDMVRDHLVEHRQEMTDSEVAEQSPSYTTIIGPTSKKTLTDLQHHRVDMIISSLHVHLDHDNCLEVLVVRGRASVVRSVAEHLIAVRGVKDGKLMLTTTRKRPAGVNALSYSHRNSTIQRTTGLRSL